MPDIVRVRVNGIEHNVGRAYATSHDLEVIDAPTHDRAGRPLPPTRKGRPLKPKTSVDDAAKKAAPKKRTPAKKAAPKTPAAPAAEKAAVESADTKKEA